MDSGENHRLCAHDGSFGQGQPGTTKTVNAAVSCVPPNQMKDGYLCRSLNIEWWVKEWAADLIPSSPIHDGASGTEQLIGEPHEEQNHSPVQSYFFATAGPNSAKRPQDVGRKELCALEMARARYSRYLAQQRYTEKNAEPEDQDDPMASYFAGSDLDWIVQQTN